SSGEADREADGERTSHVLPDQAASTEVDVALRELERGLVPAPACIRILRGPIAAGEHDPSFAGAEPRYRMGDPRAVEDCQRALARREVEALAARRRAREQAARLVDDADRDRVRAVRVATAIVMRAHVIAIAVRVQRERVIVV